MRKIFASIFVVTLAASALYALHPVYAANAGDLIKCPDFSSVYFLANDGKRYVFPNEHIYKSWYPDFDAVKTISCADLGLLPLGARVMYQPGTSLVKIPSDPSVFVVEDNEIVREIPDEATAIALFGDNWSDRVDDVSEAFWPSFTKGEPLVGNEVPEGTILEDNLSKLFRVRNDGTAIEVNSSLTADQELVLKEHAIHIDDIESRMGVTIALTQVDNTTATTVLTEIENELETVHVEQEDEVEVEDILEVEDVEDAEVSADDEVAENTSGTGSGDVADSTDESINSDVSGDAENIDSSVSGNESSDSGSSDNSGDSSGSDSSED